MVVHSYYPHDVRVRRQCEALADRGDIVDLVCLKANGESKKETIGNVNVHRLPLKHKRGQSVAGYIAEYTSFFIFASVKLAALSIRHRYRIVQVHNMPDFLVFTTLVPKILGARVLLDMHDITPELFQSIYGISEQSFTFKLLVLFEQVSLAYADGVMTVNRNIRDLFLTRNPIAHKMEVVMNAPDPRYFRYTTHGASQSYCVKRQRPFRLFHHGQIIRRYNFETALEGFSIAIKQIPQLEMDIYGDGEEQYLAEVKEWVDRHGWRDRIRFHNRVPVEQIPNLIRGADIGLVPCKKDVFVDKVMLPVRLLEYVAMGLPSICSRVGTVESYFNDTEVAYYEHNSPTDLASRIVGLYKNPSLRENMARRAMNSFRSCEWPQMQKRYYRIIDQMQACS
ncbi:MAG: glycosyltransferase family 4 protein [Candidatus Latescibacterota bacterium]|nr:glycosyltransferase family 4 protein [Candidatus Latescibacterota bacterium]